MRLGSTLPPPDPGADPNDFQITDPFQRRALGLLPLNPFGPGLGLQHIGGDPANSISTWGLPPTLASSLTAGSPGGPGDQFALSPAPTMPDYGPSLDSYSQALHNAAANKVTPLDMDVAQNTAKAAGMNAALGALPKVNLNDPAFHWNPVVPQSLGAPQMAPLPTRPAPGHDLLSMILGNIAGVVDPKGAGQYNAAPLQAGIDVSNRVYNDRLTAFQQAQQQLNQQYEAGAANAQQNNRFDLLNATQTQVANIRALDAQNAAALRSVPYVMGGAEASSLAGGLSPLAGQQRTSDVASADAAGLQFKIDTLEKQTAEATALWRATNSPIAKEAVMQMRVQSEILRAQMKNAIDQQNAITRARRVDIYGRRVDENGSLIE